MGVDDRKVRGVVPSGVVSYLERADLQRRTRALAALSPEVRERYRGFSRSDWYPIGQTVELYRAVSLLSEEPQAQYDELVRCGRHLAHEATNTFLRLLIRFLTPAVFARKFPDFWRKDHTFGRVEVDNSAFADQRLTLMLSGVDGYDFIGPICQGWIHAAFEAIGKRGVEVKELDNGITKLDASAYRFLLTWQ